MKPIDTMPDELKARIKVLLSGGLAQALELQLRSLNRSTSSTVN